MHIGILGNADSWYVRDLERAAKSLLLRVTRIDFRRLTASVDGLPTSVVGDTIALHELDAVIVRTMPPGSLEQVVYRMDTLARLEARGVTVFNPARSLECAVDKFLTTSRLAAAALPVPATILCEDSESAMTAFDELGGDVVVKPLFGSEGRGIVRVSDREIAQRVFRTLERIQAVLYIQRYVRHRGYDTRVLVLDGTVIGGMQRIAHDGFRTNVSQRGTTARCELSELERDLALRAIAVTGARFAGIDLLFDDDDRPWVIEVNAVPGWKAFAATTGIDVATVVLQTLVVSNRERNDGRTEAD